MADTPIIKKEVNTSRATIYWAWLGKFSLIISVVFTIIQLFKPLFIKEYNIEAIASFKPYDMPESLLINFDKFICKVDSVSKKNRSSLEKSLSTKFMCLDFTSKLLDDMKNDDYNIPDNVSDDMTELYKMLYPEQDST